MAELPPGFVLDGPVAAPQAASGMPAPPPGFVMDEAADQAAQPAAPDNRSFLGRVGDNVTNIAKNVSTLRLSDILKGVVESGKSAVTLPGDVYQGKVDLGSEDAIKRSMDFAGLFSPSSVANKGNLVVTPRQPAIARDAAEAGVTLTAGQRSGNPALLSKEDAMLGGGLGTRAQEVAHAAKARQADEIFRARDAIGDVAGRGVAQLERPQDAGGIVADAVKANAASAKLGYQDKYKAAFSGDGAFKPAAFEGMSARVADSLVNRADPVIIDDLLTPAASRALKELDSIQNLKLGNIGQPGAGDAVAGVNLRGVDQARRKLAAFAKAAPTPTDKRAVSEIIKEFDGQLTKAVDDGLFLGDEKFLDALKDARGAFASYQRTFKPQGAGDDVGRVLNTMVGREVTPEQVANYIYGSSKVGANPTSVRVVGRLKELLGPESAELSAVRQGVWQKITGVAEGKTPMGGQKASERILEFVKGDGQSLAKQLFSPDELRLMTKHAYIEKATAAKPGTVNYSGSGNRAAGLARESLAAVMGALGFATSGPAAGGALYGAGKAAGSIGDLRAASQARKLFSGQEPVALGVRAGQGAGSLGETLALPAAVELLPGKREVRK